jgi:predicted nucleic acid-binding protein
MILVDTSVLIDFFRGKSTESVEKMNTLLSENTPFGINHYIYQELLQGAGSEKEFVHLKTYLNSQIFYDLRKGRESFASASKIYYRCRKAGITIKSTIDLLIVETALENNLALLHSDTDFTAIKKVVPELQMY